MDCQEIRRGIHSNFLYGGLSGMFGVIVSHPIDTIKTKIQENIKVSRSLRDLPKLYKGITPPLIGVGMEKALVFGIYETMSRNLLVDQNKYIKTSISGACAGMGATFIVTPFERLKILLQTDKKLRRQTFVPRNIFKGLSATFTRETPGFAIYFSTYEALKEKFYRDRNITKCGSFMFGGLSGAMAWVFIYPQDRIKTKMQASEKRITFRDSLREVYLENGFRGFYRGFHYALMRAVPLHAGTFMMMEILKKQYMI
jgi:solute carrier family 25 (mitochondrial carnitine/acylcarnitine transporter), member 20/29